MEVLIYVTSLSSLAAFKIPSFSLTFDNLIINIMSLNISPIQVQTIWGPLDLMDLDVLFSSHVREVFSHYCFKYTFCLFLFLFLFSFWNSHKSCRLSSLFFILFSFCSSEWIISNMLSSKRMILSSAWSSLLLKFATEFFSSVIVFFNSKISVRICCSCCCC